MYSIGFPNMFSGSKTNLIEDTEATMSNLKLLLKSHQGSLLGDPKFGTRLKHVFYSNNSPILRDLIIDEIYIAISNYMPQLKVSRDDIKIIQNRTRVYASVNCINLIDNTPNLFEIDLITG